MDKTRLLVVEDEEAIRKQMKWARTAAAFMAAIALAAITRTANMEGTAA